MAKQYIPGVSGLLTEPNPADSPSNTLSEAENVIIEQGGKVQARHGFNVTEEDAITNYSLFEGTKVPSIDNLKGTASIVGSLELTGNIVINSSNNVLYFYRKSALTYYGYPWVFASVTSNTYTLETLVAALNASTAGVPFFSIFNNRIKITTSEYIEIGPGSMNSTLGLTEGTYSYANKIVDTYTNNVAYNTIYSSNDIFYKFFQFKNEIGSPITGYIVKQNRNQYGLEFDNTNNFIYNVAQNYTNNPVYRIYQIDSDGSKLINFDQVPYDTVTNILTTDKTLYLSTEDGLVESNIQDTFIPTYKRFFTIKWPTFPEVIYSFSQSSTTENWLKSGYKCGIRITFFREVGYSDTDSLYEYESQPSKIYEIFNNGKDSILNLELNFKAVIENTELYKQFNEFTKFNNGRKFGIKIYRTKSVPISVIVDNVPVAKALPEEYRLCALPIYFDSLFSTSLVRLTDFNGVEKIGFEEYGAVSQYRKESTLGEAKLNDIYAYIPNTTNVAGTIVNTGSLFSSNKVQYETTDIRDNDIIPGKLQITGKNINSVIEAFSATDKFLGSGSNTTSNPTEVPYIFPSDSTNYFAFPYKTQESITKYVNSAELVFMTTFAIQADHRTIFNSNSELEISFWEYERITKSNPITGSTEQFLNLKTKLSSGLLKLTDNIYKNQPLTYILDQGIETAYLSNLSVTIGYTGSTTFNNNQVTYVDTGNIYIYEGMPIKFGGSVSGLPVELSQSTTYFVKSLSSNGRSFSLSLTLGGSAITFSNKTYNSSQIVTVYTVGLWRVNFSLNQMLQINPSSSYMVVVKCKSIPSAYRLSLPLMKNSSYTVDGGLSYPLYNVETFSWQDGSKPSNYRLITQNFNEGGSATSLQNYGLKLSRKEYKYNYNFTAVNYIRDAVCAFTFLPANQQLNIVETPSTTTGYPRASAHFIEITASSPNAIKFRTYTTTDPSILPHSNKTYVSHNLISGTKIRFLNNVFINLSTAITYYVKVIDSDEFEISASLNGSSITNAYKSSMELSEANFYVYESYPLIDSRYVIKNFSVILDSNDDYILNLPELYTNPFQDGEDYSNTIAPDSKLIGQYKDVTLYAGIKEPLTASFSVTKLPAVESIRLYHGSSGTGTTFSGVGSVTNTSFFFAETYTGTLLSTDFTSKREIYIDSNIFNKKISQITGFTTSQISTTGNIVSRWNYSSSTYNSYFNATIYEKPYLTLKLTSTKNDINYISIQTNSFYNRNGYYSLTDKNGNLDDKFLQVSGALSELNASQTRSTTVALRYELIPHMIPGTKTGQIEPDGYHIPASEFGLTASASNAIHYNTTTNTLTLTGINNFDFKKFVSPGILLIQGLNTVNSVDDVAKYYGLFNYQTIEVDSTTSNKYIFKGVNLNYYSKDGRVLFTSEISSNIASFSAKKYYLYFIKSTTDKNIPIYAYTAPYVSSVDYNSELVDGTTRPVVKEYYNNLLGTSIFNSQPVFTFKPHNNRDSTVVGILSSNGDFRFGGVDQKDTPSYWDDYAWSIINEFNKALDLKGINAKLRKGSGTGEVVISYPDGYSIELLNGKYGSTIPYIGSHQFSPEINSQSFTKLAVRDDNELYLKNQIQLSRRNIPEISTLLSYISLGKPEKEFIAMAGNVDDFIVFKEDGVFRIIDSGNYNTRQDIPYFQPSQISTTLICQATGSVQEINGEIIFLSQEGFVSIDGGQIINISQAIQRDILTLIQTSPKERIRSFVNKSKNIYCCTLVNETTTSEVKTGTYVFNVKTRQWSFINEEILDGFEDFEKRSLVAYKQKTIEAALNTQTTIAVNYQDRRVSKNGNFITYSAKVPTYDFTYPLTLSSNFNNFYMISRERHTDNLFFNNADQYDFISKKWTSGFTFTAITNGFKLTVNGGDYINFYSPRVNNLANIPFSIYEYRNGYIYCHLIDNAIQFFYNRKVYIRFYDINGNSEIFEVKLTKLNATGVPTNSINQVMYTFEYISVPSSSWTNLTVKGVRLELGVPAKITFNPESGNQPDTNKLFQEFMIHTETSNRSMAMNFKIDGKTSFLSTDRKFEYDSTVNNRNVFRTYVPTSVARGRYLIRQVKHDLPLENLIITGQTIVMRDSGSTRAQKDKDNQ